MTNLAAGISQLWGDAFAIPDSRRLLALLLVSIGVGLSNFAASIGIGLSGVDARTRLKVGVAFGLFESLMPIGGLLLGAAAAGFLGTLGRYLGAGLLVLTGGYTIIQGRRAVKEEQVEAGARSLKTHHLVVTAIALSLDNLVVGFALGDIHVPILLAAVVIGVVSVALSLAGLELGRRLGARVEARSEELAGGVLILVGIALSLGIL